MQQIPIDLVRQPDSAFTVVRGNETIQDVAVRIYGSNDHVGMLWRANRDALSLLRLAAVIGDCAPDAEYPLKPGPRAGSFSVGSSTPIQVRLRCGSR